MTSGWKLPIGIALAGAVATAGLVGFRVIPPAKTSAPNPAISERSAAIPSSYNSPPVLTSASTKPNPQITWEKQFADTTNYFDFVSKAANKAYEGDGRAAFFISKALYQCMPIARQYAHSANPEADFTAYWATMTKAPQWVLDKAQKDFRSCVGFIKGDAFAGLPERPQGYNSSGYWMDKAAASDDPVAQALKAGDAISNTDLERSSSVSAKSLASAQLAINSAVASKDPAAMFQVGQLLSDGHASNDPLQGFAVSIAACDLGYNCTASNEELFRGCAAQGTCPAGMNYADVIKAAVGEDGYAKAYARAQQLEDAMNRGDKDAIEKFLQISSSSPNAKQS